MTSDEEKLLLREIAIEACERLGEGLRSRSPTAVRLHNELAPDAATTDVDIVAYTAFLADTEVYELRKRDVDLGDAWLGKFTYDLEKPCLTEPASIEYRRLQKEEKKLREELKAIERERVTGAKNSASRIDDPHDPMGLVESGCFANNGLGSGRWDDTSKNSKRKLSAKAESEDGAVTAKATQKKSTRRSRTDSVVGDSPEKRLSQQREEIHRQLNQFCTAGVEGVISPTASNLGLAAWAIILVNKHLIKNESLHQRAQKQLRDACMPTEKEVKKDASHLAKPSTRKRGGQKKTAKDIELWNAYRAGLERGSWLTVAAFARDRGMKPGTARIAVSRGEAEQAKLNVK